MDHHRNLLSLFLFPNSQLYLFSSGSQFNSLHRTLIHHGDFSLRLLSPLASPTLSSVVAAVGDFHWPLSLDVHVRRETPTCFSFFLPGSSSPSYAVVFASPPPDLPALESFLQAYSRYNAHGRLPPCAAATLLPLPMAPTYVYQRPVDLSSSSSYLPPCALHAELPVPGLAASTSTDLSDRCSASPVSKFDRHTPAARSAGSRDSSCSAMEALASLQTARMMSAVVKLLSRSLERGVIRAEAHTVDFSPYPFTAQSMPDTENCGGDERLVASVDAVIKVMRAVRNGGGLAGDGIFSSAHDHTAPEAGVADKDTNMNGGDRRLRCWTLNRKGVEVMVAMIRALMRTHNSMNVEGMAASEAGGRWRTTAGSTHSDHQDGCYGESAGQSTAASCSPRALPPRPRRPTALRYHSRQRTWC